jgi:hypothetical protein
MSIFSGISNAIFGNTVRAATGQAHVATVDAEGNPQPQPAAAPAAAAQGVDVEAALVQISTSKGNPNLNWRSSIVDLMKLLDIDSSLDNRKELATELGYTGAKDGSAEMNIWLHRRVMDELERNGGIVPDSLKN